MYICIYMYNVYGVVSRKGGRGRERERTDLLEGEGPHVPLHVHIHTTHVILHTVLVLLSMLTLPSSHQQRTHWTAPLLPPLPPNFLQKPVMAPLPLLTGAGHLPMRNSRRWFSLRPQRPLSLVLTHAGHTPSVSPGATCSEKIQNMVSCWERQ